MVESAGASRPDAVRGQSTLPRTPVVRASTVADAPRLADINAVTWRAAYAGVVPDDYLQTMTPDRLLHRWTSRLAESPTDRITLVAEVGDVLAGYAVGGPYRVQQDADLAEDTAGWRELYALYTDPAHQRQGAGTALHDAMLSRLAVGDPTVAGLWVLRDNERARRWYAGRGWRADGASSMWHGSGQPLEEIRMLRRFAPRGSADAGTDEKG